MNRGVLVAADISQEWILPWWWEHYKRKNHLPVVFVDLGMSFEKKAWCKERGKLIPLRVFDFAAAREEMEPSLVQKFEEEYGVRFWECRNAWFKKPLACLQSPFDTTLWIDIDCEVRCCVEPLFDFPGFALAKDQIALTSPYQVYNSGVIVFKRSLPLIERWASEAMKKSELFRGDQELLSWMIAEEKVPVTELPPLYNWSRSLGENPEAKIYHWHGINGKKVIRHELHSWNTQL
ncbi:MAG TPA: hypothetical protein VLF94_01850 [Chlamydiales bacterium]|nr:hypothetical protein [Chlamydiales bacterium]